LHIAKGFFLWAAGHFAKLNASHALRADEGVPEARLAAAHKLSK